MAELLRSPLVLHVVALAYHGRSAAALAAPGSVQVRQARLWDAFIARMFEQRPLSPGCGYTDKQARGWLSWLAQRMRDLDQVEFHLDRPTAQWLVSPTWRRVVR